MIAERRDVWIAQSDLFLDTDVRLSFAYIARVTAGSPYSLAELEAICRDEVAPIVESNLSDIAGEWAGFPEDWLIRSIVQRLEKNPKTPFSMDTDALEQWRAVAHLVSCLRALPPEQRDERSHLWHAMSKLFLNRSPTPPEKLPRDPALLEWVYRYDMLPSYGASVDGYYRHNPKGYPTMPELEATFREWLLAAR